MGRAKICNVNGLSVEGPWNWRVNRLVFSALYMGKADLRRKARTGYHGYRLMGPWYWTFSFLCEPPADRSFKFSPLLPGWGGGNSRINYMDTCSGIRYGFRVAHSSTKYIHERWGDLIGSAWQDY